MPRRSTHLTTTEAELAKAASRKIAAGEKLTVRESRVWDKAERLHRERQIASVASGIPISVLATWTGRGSDNLQRAAKTYGLPCGDEQVKLPELLRAMFDLIASNAGALRVDPDDDSLALADESSPALERLRMAKAKRAELELEEMRGDLVRKADVAALVSSVASAVRDGLATLERDHGQQAADDFHATIESAVRDAQRELEP